MSSSVSNPFAGLIAAKPAPAPVLVVTPTAPVDETPPYAIPFDGQRPILVCGHPSTGKTSFLRHLIAREGTRQGVYVIDPIGSHFTLPGRRTTILNPTLATSDSDFYLKAASVVHAVLAEPGPMLVIDALHVMAAPYKYEVPGQQEFLAAVEQAIRTLNGKGSRLVIAQEPVPAAHRRDLFGARFFMGESNSIDWSLLFGSSTHIQSKRVRGGGVMWLDNAIYDFAFPWLPVEQEPQPEAPQAPATKSLWAKIR